MFKKKYLFGSTPFFLYLCKRKNQEHAKRQDDKTNQYHCGCGKQPCHRMEEQTALLAAQRLEAVQAAHYGPHHRDGAPHV